MSWEFVRWVYIIQIAITFFGLLGVTFTMTPPVVPFRGEDRLRSTISFFTLILVASILWPMTLITVLSWSAFFWYLEHRRIDPPKK